MPALASLLCGFIFGLGLVISIHRHTQTTNLDEMNRMKG